MAEHGTITGYRKLNCHATDPCPASPTCAQVKAAGRKKPEQSDGSAPNRVPARWLIRDVGAQGKAVLAQFADLTVVERAQNAVLLAAADSLALVIDFGDLSLVASAVARLREVEAEINKRTEGAETDELAEFEAGLTPGLRVVPA